MFDLFYGVRDHYWEGEKYYFSVQSTPIRQSLWDRRRAKGSPPGPQKNNIPEETEMNVEKQTKAKPGAIFHFDCKVHGRSTGANAIRLAAYRSGSRLRSELTGRIHNYTRKKEVLWSEILAPPHAPAWSKDRATLWNAVDRIEHRCDAQLAREVEVSLPLRSAPSSLPTSP